MGETPLDIYEVVGALSPDALAPLEIHEVVSPDGLVGETPLIN